MILCDEQLKPRAVKSFEAEILVLHHPTRIATGYEPIVHLSTVSETAKIKLVDKSYMKASDVGKAEFAFKYKSCYIDVGEKFVFREGKTKGIGTVTKILKYVG